MHQNKKQIKKSFYSGCETFSTSSYKEESKTRIEFDKKILNELKIYGLSFWQTDLEMAKCIICADEKKLSCGETCNCEKFVRLINYIHNCAKSSGRRRR